MKYAIIILGIIATLLSSCNINTDQQRQLEDLENKRREAEKLYEDSKQAAEEVIEGVKDVGRQLEQIQTQRPGLLSPFNLGVTWTAISGYYNNTSQSSEGCGVGGGPGLDHCRNQLFGLDLKPSQPFENDKTVLAPASGTVALLAGDCILLTLEDNINLNVCHFASTNVKEGEKVERGKVLGIRSTSWVHISLDNRHNLGTLCNSGKCFLPVPFSGTYSLEGMSLDPDLSGDTVTLPYERCAEKGITCQFQVKANQYSGNLAGISTNIAIP